MRLEALVLTPVIRDKVADRVADAVCAPRRDARASTTSRGRRRYAYCPALATSSGSIDCGDGELVERGWMTTTNRPW